MGVFNLKPGTSWGTLTCSERTQIKEFHRNSFMIMIFCLIKDPPLQLPQLNLSVQASKWHQLRTQPRADWSTDTDSGPTDTDLGPTWLFLSSFQGKEGLFIYWRSQSCCPCASSWVSLTPWGWWLPGFFYAFKTFKHYKKLFSPPGAGQEQIPAQPQSSQAEWPQPEQSSAEKPQ